LSNIPLNMDPKLQIVMFTYGLPFTGNTLENGPLGGAETAFIYLGRELAKLGHNVIAFCPCSEEGVFDGVQYLNHGRFDGWRTKEACDVFICSRFYEVFNRPIDAKVRVLWLHDHLAPANIPGLRSVLPTIDYIYCLSNYHREYTAGLIPESAAKLRVTYNGVDLELIDSVRKNTPAKRHKMMYIARPERGLSEALEIYTRLNDKQLEFLACSYPYPEECLEDVYTPVSRQLEQQGFKMSFGEFKKEELYRHIAESEVVIYPSNTPEIFCIGAVETQACGTVFLARELGALSETVGYPCQKGINTDGFLNAARQVLLNADFRKVLEHMGLQHARQFSWDRVARQFADEALSYEREQTDAPAPVVPAEIRETVPHLEPDRISLANHENLPKISCLTVTKDRILLLKDSVQCFLQQTYPNKELIIIAAGEGHYRNAVESYIAGLNQPSIRLIWFDGEDYSLGKARNLSLEAATGEIICIWDDDDLYHPERLSRQYLHMAGQDAEGCCLTDFLQFFEKDATLFWVDWKFGGTLKGHEKMLPGSLMAVKKDFFKYEETGERAHQGEDNVLMDDIARRMKIVGLDDCGFLYVYRFHSKNVHPEQHHRNLGAFGRQTAEYLKPRFALLMEALKLFPLPSPVTVLSRDGKSFLQHLK
jgi:glycosyltransferase involved in cell wall biosynthesis